MGPSGLRRHQPLKPSVALTGLVRPHYGKSSPNNSVSAESLRIDIVPDIQIQIRFVVLVHRQFIDRSIRDRRLTWAAWEAADSNQAWTAGVDSSVVSVAVPIAKHDAARRGRRPHPHPRCNRAGPGPFPSVPRHSPQLLRALGPNIARRFAFAAPSGTRVEEVDDDQHVLRRRSLRPR